MQASEFLSFNSLLIGIELIYIEGIYIIPCYTFNGLLIENQRHVLKV